MGDLMIPVAMRPVADDWHDVAARTRDPDRGRCLVEFEGPFGSAAVALVVTRRAVAVVGDGVAPLVLDAPSMSWPPSSAELSAGVSGSLEGSAVVVRADMRSWRPSRRFVAVEVDGRTTHRLRKTAWREELVLRDRTGRVVGSTCPVTVSADASPLDTSLVLVLATLDLLDRMTFAHGVLRYV